MKKYSLLIVIMLLAHVSSFALEPIFFDVEIYDHSTVGPGPNRGPVLVPEVSIEGYTLFFGTPCDGSVLRLLDEDGFVVYSTVIPTGTTTLPLPTTLSGDYELQIIRDGWCFYGWIILEL